MEFRNLLRGVHVAFIMHFERLLHTHRVSFFTPSTDHVVPLKVASQATRGFTRAGGDIDKPRVKDKHMSSPSVARRIGAYFLVRDLSVAYLQALPGRA